MAAEVEDNEKEDGVIILKDDDNDDDDDDDDDDNVDVGVFFNCNAVVEIEVNVIIIMRTNNADADGRVFIAIFDTENTPVVVSACISKNSKYLSREARKNPILMDDTEDDDSNVMKI